VHAGTGIHVTPVTHWARSPVGKGLVLRVVAMLVAEAREIRASLTAALEAVWETKAALEVLRGQGGPLQEEM